MCQKFSRALSLISAAKNAKRSLLSVMALVCISGCDALGGAGGPAADLGALPIVEAADGGDESVASKTFVPHRLLLKFKVGTGAEDQQRILNAAQARVVGEIREIGAQIIELPGSASETAQMQVFNLDPHVEFAELDIVHLPALVTPNDYWYFGQWHLPKINAPSAWASTTGSSSIIIAICDTGVDGSHPDLASKMVPGWNVYSNTSDTSDPMGHGTAAAGIVAAASNNSVGVASVAWDCRIMPIRIGNATGATSSSIIASGLVWAADHGARVANISFGVVGSSIVSSAAQYFNSRGGVVTSSSGNNGTYFTIPDDPHVITVSATDPTDALASFSNFGTFVDISAPGAGIYSTARGGGYAASSGTSFAAPIVAGVAALVLSVNPELTAVQVQDILKQSTDDLGTPGWDTTFSWGRVNAGRAVAMATDSLAPPVDVSAPAVNFVAPLNDAAVSGSVAVQVNAEDNVGVESVTFSVDGTLIATDLASPFSFAWNTPAHSNGTHELKALAMDEAGNSAEAVVRVNVGNFYDSIPPTVVVSWPRSGYGAIGTVPVTVIASDNVGVSRVELHVDGVIKSVSTSAPFSTVWNARLAVTGPHQLVCKAFDAAGNLAQSAVVTVNKLNRNSPGS